MSTSLIVPKLDPARIEVLASILRRARASNLGHNTELNELRERRSAIRAQSSLVASSAQARGFSSKSVSPELDRLDGQLADLASQISEIEAIQRVNLSAAHAARANLEAAIAVADENNFPVRREVLELLR